VFERKKRRGGGNVRVSWNKVRSKGVVDDRHDETPKAAREEDGAWLTEAEQHNVFLRRCRWVLCGNQRMREMALGRSYMHALGWGLLS
jgi:hypothetical protein